MERRLKRKRPLAEVLPSGVSGPVCGLGARADPPSAAGTSAGKAGYLEALRNSVADASSTSAGLWFSYLFLLFYLLVAAGGVTHRDLFLGNPVKLPFLNVELPLVGFFWMGPTIFLIVHAHALLNFALLASKVGALDAELRAQDDGEMRTRLRWQLPSNVFVQLLAGPREVRDGLMGFMLRLVSRISLVGGPVLLLVFFELQFLPYHDWAVSWWQRMAVVADLALVWILWPSIARGEPMVFAWRAMTRRKIVTWGVVSLAPVLLVFTIATFPGELLDNNPANPATLRFIPTKWPNWNSPAAAAAVRLAIDTMSSGTTSNRSSVGRGDRSPVATNRGFFERGVASAKSMGWISPHSWLVAGTVDLGTRKPSSLFSNRLVLPDLDAIDHSKFDNEANFAGVSETVSLRMRDLRGAVLIGARLRKADFTGANLQDAYLDRADLREARFECASNGLNLGDPTRTEHRRIDCTQLQGGRLSDAQLQGASLNGAHLQGASLMGAHLQGANLSEAELQGADLYSAELQTADLDQTSLEGASLIQADLRGALLDLAHIQGANLLEAMLQGASLDEAGLQGASLNRAELQGVDLSQANFQDASLSHLFIWRAGSPASDATRGARIDALQTGRTRACNFIHGPVCTWSAEDFAKLKLLIQGKVPQETPDGNLRTTALARIDSRLNPTRGLEREGEMAKAWMDLERASHTSDDVYEAALAKRWRELGCATEGAPYVISGLLRQLEFEGPFAEESPQKHILAKAFLDEEHCVGAHGLSEDQKARLRKIRDRASP